MRLQSLSDQEILSRIHELASQERSLTRQVLLHLNEIERRRLHLKLGYASMFDYCTSGLGYSASSAARRIRTARCIERFPEVLALLEKNEVNLSTVSQVSRVLSAENKDRVLTRIKGKSQREVDAMVAEYEPRAMPADRVKPVVVRVPVAVAAGAGRAGASVFEDGAAAAVAVAASTAVPERVPADADDKHCRSGSEKTPNTVIARRMLLSFSASEQFMAKLDKIKSLAWHRLPANPSLEQVFELVMDQFIEREDPGARRERREERKAATRDNAQKRAPKVLSSTEQQSRPQRHVAACVRDDVFTRDQGQCTYVGATGKRCSSTHALQIDHIEPIARGGVSTPPNLRLLCAYHNRLEAGRILGRNAPRVTTDSSPTRTTPGSSRDRPFRAPT